MLGLELLGGDGARPDHQDLRAELLEGPGELFAFGILLDKIKELKISVGVADDRVEVFQLQQADETVVILEGLELEARAIFGVQGEVFFGGGLLRQVEIE